MKDVVSDIKDEHHPKPFVEGKYLARWLPDKNKWLEWGTERAPALFRRRTFPELYEAEEKLISITIAADVEKLRVAYDNQKSIITIQHTVLSHGTVWQKFGTDPLNRELATAMKNRNVQIYRSGKNLKKSVVGLP